MTTDDKLAAILAAIQIDPGDRGLARDPRDNLFNACAGDFAAACRSIAGHSRPFLHLLTGFLIPAADPPAFETDGPLGAVFIIRSLMEFDLPVVLCSTESDCAHAIAAGLEAADLIPSKVLRALPDAATFDSNWIADHTTHVIAIERPGPAANGRYQTMRGRDITASMLPAHRIFEASWDKPKNRKTIGIGDGGNEIGMGKIPHQTIVRNIPNGDLIHCRVPTDELIVAGVSNWAAYALVAGISLLCQAKPPATFDPDCERRILEAMVHKGRLVDGVTGKPTATVDGLSWEEYIKPFIRIRDILEM